MPSDNHKQHEQIILEMVRELVRLDEELRIKYQVGEKFRFVRDRLGGVLEQLEKNVRVTVAAQKSSVRELQEGEVMVYVYLFNAHGMQLKNWQNLVKPKVFYEYSINRPVYAERKYIDTVLRSKSNKMQHAFLGIALKPEDVKDTGAKDALANPIIKVKEGSLRLENLICFIHNDIDYTVTEEGEFVKKEK